MLVMVLVAGEVLGAGCPYVRDPEVLRALRRKQKLLDHIISLHPPCPVPSWNSCVYFPSRSPLSLCKQSLSSVQINQPI